MHLRDGQRRRLRIAQVAPLYLRVPPARYGGTERVISDLTSELVRRGHDVTLFAAGSSSTAARLTSIAPRPLWEMEAHERLPYEIIEIEAVVRSAGDFDVIHWHLEYLHWLVSTSIGVPSVTTLHGRLDSASVRTMFTEHREEAVISISDAQRRPVADVRPNWVATIHHGLDFERSYHLGSGDGGYLAFVGRSCADKGLGTAIRVAIRAGLAIKIAARVGEADFEYHDAEVVPLLDHPLVEFLGEITDREKAHLLASARALLMPINWEEPFGLSFVEALAAGTPIITTPRGALPELMRHGVHGLFAQTEDELVEACRDVLSIDRGACRQWALEQFSVSRMADDYEAAYTSVIDARTMPEYRPVRPTGKIA